MTESEKSIGDQEMALLRDLAEHGDASVGEVLQRFGEPNGWARSTVLTVMERLRKKGYLERHKVDGVYRYGTRSDSDELLQGAVSRFIDKTLRGSVSPFFAWMSRREQVSEDELQALEALVAKLRSERKER